MNHDDEKRDERTARHEKSLPQHEDLTVSDAYRKALDQQRIAVKTGQQDIAWREGLMTRGLSNLVDQSGQTGWDARQHAANQAVAKDAWGDALTLVDSLLSLNPQDVDVRGRALRNRATILTTLGRFEESVEAYRHLVDDDAVWQSMAPSYQTGFHLAYLMARYYLGQVVVSDLDVVTPMFASAPMTWQLYWWLLGHLTVEHRPDRWESVRQASVRTFEEGWPIWTDIVLWGLDLRQELPERWERTEAKVRQTLSDAFIVQAIGRSAWMDLTADWIVAWMAHDEARGRHLMAQHATWCAEQGYDGWAQYWMKKLG